MLKPVWFKLLLLLWLAWQPLRAETVTVAVSANLRFAFLDLQTIFTRQTGIELQPVYSSSGKITAQIQHGAPYQVFLSADLAYPQALYQAGLTRPPRVYAYGSLVLWSRKKQSLADWPALLASGQIYQIALANPRLAPYGQETVRVLQHYQIYQQVLPKLVYGESILQTSHYIESGAVDLGFTAKSAVVSSRLAGEGSWLEIPPESYQPIAQAAALVNSGATAAAENFYDFLFSSQARAVFERYGYQLP